METVQDQILERAYADLRELREGHDAPSANVSDNLDRLEESLAQLDVINEDLNEKNLNLAAQYHRFRELFEIAPDALLVTDLNGVILEANAAAAVLFKKKDVTFLSGKPLTLYVAESDRHMFALRIAQLKVSSETVSWDMRVAPHDGPYRSVTCRVVPSPARGSKPALLYWMLHDVTEHVDLERRLAALHADLRQLSNRLVTIQEDERKRISRELHDEAGQGLIALRMNLDALRRDLAPEQTDVRDRLIEAGELAFRTVERLRILAQDLRPPAIDVVDLDSVLLQLCHEMTARSKLPIKYEGTQLPPVDMTVKVSLYRFLQEALSNVVRHSQATQAEVCLEGEADTVILSVVDNGIGFDTRTAFHPTTHPGIGLIGMKERIELLGGKLELESEPDQGTRIAAVVPVR